MNFEIYFGKKLILMILMMMPKMMPILVITAASLKEKILRLQRIAFLYQN
jgi:hypothetical protein